MNFCDSDGTESTQVKKLQAKSKLDARIRARLIIDRAIRSERGPKPDITCKLGPVYDQRQWDKIVGDYYV
jgi:hypothetical protein